MTKKRYVVRFARPMSRGEFRVIDTQQPITSQNFIVDRFMHCPGGRQDAHDLAWMLNAHTASNAEPANPCNADIIDGYNRDDLGESPDY